MTALEIVLVRHGETDWNKEHVFRGREDVRLNELGIAQAEAAGEALKDRLFEAVYSSPLKRALVTARRIAAPHDIQVRVNEGFNDINFGRFQAMKAETARKTYPKLYDKWLESPQSVRFPAGESVKKSWKRVNTALRELLFLHGTGTVVIVSHRVPLKFMTAYLLGKHLADIKSIRHDPGAMSVFKVHGRMEYEPVVLNDTSHMRKLSIQPQDDF